MYEKSREWLNVFFCFGTKKRAIEQIRYIIASLLKDCSIASPVLKTGYICGLNLSTNYAIFAYIEVNYNRYNYLREFNFSA